MRECVINALGVIHCKFNVLINYNRNLNLVLLNSGQHFLVQTNLYKKVAFYAKKGIKYGKVFIS